MDFNKLEKRLWKQNKSNTGLKLELKAIKAEFEDVSNYLKKKSHKVEQLKTIIDRLIAAKIKTDTILPSIKF